MGQVGGESVTFTLTRLWRRSVTRPTQGDIDAPALSRWAALSALPAG